MEEFKRPIRKGIEAQEKGQVWRPGSSIHFPVAPQELTKQSLKRSLVAESDLKYGMGHKKVPSLCVTTIVQRKFCVPCSCSFRCKNFRAFFVVSFFFIERCQKRCKERRKNGTKNVEKTVQRT